MASQWHADGQKQPQLQQMRNTFSAFPHAEQDRPGRAGYCETSSFVGAGLPLKVTGSPSLMTSVSAKQSAVVCKQQNGVETGQPMQTPQLAFGQVDSQRQHHLQLERHLPAEEHVSLPEQQPVSHKERYEWNFENIVGLQHMICTRMSEGRTEPQYDRGFPLPVNQLDERIFDALLGNRSACADYIREAISNVNALQNCSSDGRSTDYDPYGGSSGCVADWGTSWVGSPTVVPLDALERSTVAASCSSANACSGCRCPCDANGATECTCHCIDLYKNRKAIRVLAPGTTIDRFFRLEGLLKVCCSEDDVTGASAAPAPIADGKDATDGQNRKPEARSVVRRPLLYHAVDLITHERCILKVVSKKSVASEADDAMLRSRLCAHLLNLPQHPNVLACTDIFEDSESFYFVSEQLEGCELFDFLVREKSVEEKVCQYIILQILRALHHLHTHNLLHRDVKPENLIFRRATRCHTGGTHNNAGNSESASDCGGGALPMELKHELLLIDFDTCIFRDQVLPDPSQPRRRRLVGTYGYLAPEVLKAGTYSTASDMWSVGVILYILMTGTTPLPMELMTSARASFAVFKIVIEKGGIDFGAQSLPEFALAQDLCRKLLELDPTKRLSSAAEAMRHPWFRDFYANKRSRPSSVPAYEPTVSFRGPCRPSAKADAQAPGTSQGKAKPSSTFCHPDGCLLSCFPATLADTALPLKAGKAESFSTGLPSYGLEATMQPIDTMGSECGTPSVCADVSHGFTEQKPRDSGGHGSEVKTAPCPANLVPTLQHKPSKDLFPMAAMHKWHPPVNAERCASRPWPGPHDHTVDEKCSELSSECSTAPGAANLLSGCSSQSSLAGSILAGSFCTSASPGTTPSSYSPLVGARGCVRSAGTDAVRVTGNMSSSSLVDVVSSSRSVGESCSSGSGAFSFHPPAADRTNDLRHLHYLVRVAEQTDTHRQGTCGGAQTQTQQVLAGRASLPVRLPELSLGDGECMHSAVCLGRKNMSSHWMADLVVSSFRGYCSQNQRCAVGESIDTARNFSAEDPQERSGGQTWTQQPHALPSPQVPELGRRWRDMAQGALAMTPTLGLSRAGDAHLFNSCQESQNTWNQRLKAQDSSMRTLPVESARAYGQCNNSFEVGGQHVDGGVFDSCLHSRPSPAARAFCGGQSRSKAQAVGSTFQDIECSSLQLPHLLNDSSADGKCGES